MIIASYTMAAVGFMPLPSGCVLVLGQFIARPFAMHGITINGCIIKRAGSGSKYGSYHAATAYSGADQGG